MGKEKEEGGFWLDAPIEKMGLKELEKFKNSIEEQREKVADRVEEMAIMMVTETKNGAADRSSTTRVEYAPPQQASVLRAKDLAADDDDSHIYADLQDFHFGFDFDFDFDEPFF